MLGRVAKLAVAVIVAAPGFSKTIEDQDVARWAKAGGLGYLIGATWTEGEAAEKQIAVSDEDVREAIEPPHDGLGRQDRLYAARIRLLDAQLRAPVLQAAAQSVTQEQIDAYVQAHPLESRGERRVRLLVARDPARARAVERALRRGVTWERAGRRYASGVGSRLLAYPAPPGDRLERAIFRAAKNHVTRYGRYVFKVVGVTPSGPLPVAQQHATAWEVLASEAQARALTGYRAAITAKWRPRTACATPAAAQGFCSGSPTGQ